MPEKPEQQSDPLNRLVIDVKSLATTIEMFAQNPISEVPDEERPKMFAAIKITSTHGMLSLIREELVRLVQERIRSVADKDWSYLEEWDSSVPEETLAEEAFVARMQQGTRDLIAQIGILGEALPQHQQEYLLPAIDEIHTLLNTLRSTLFQFVITHARQNPEDQLLGYVKMNSTFATLLGAPVEESPDV